MITVKRTTKNKKQKLVGRGGTRGKTSGRGTKGQKSRAGHSIRPQIRDMIKKYPKLRGRGKNGNKSFRVVPATVNISALAGFETVTPAILLQKGLIRRTAGVLPRVKILAGGELKKALTIYDCDVTEAARLKIEAAGGTIK